MRFEITRVSCDGEEFEPFDLVVDRDLEDILIPGGIPSLEDDPLDAGSEHLFADLFVTLEPGCYDVTSTPVTADGDPSADCVGATKHGVEVTEGEVTEVFLVDQCHADDPGGIDVIEALNHEPEIDDVSFEDSKFTLCDAPVVICATANDPDGDPIEFVWSVSPAADGPTLVSSTINTDGSVSQCVQFVPHEAGTFDVTLTVYDMLWDGGVLMRIEDWLADEGYPSESHAEIDFFFRAGECGGGEGGAGGGGATGGEPGTGGAATGGDTGAGGAATGGDAGAGGETGDAGAGGATGGEPGTGGAATGGEPATGGAATGGEPATGGVATGGEPGTGGVATGGEPATGGAPTGGAGGCEGLSSDFDIDVTPVGALDPAMAGAISAGATRWSSLIVGDIADLAVSLPANFCGVGEPAFSGTIDDLKIYALSEPIDGPGGVLGFGGPCAIRTVGSLPLLGVMLFDSADIGFLVGAGLIDGTMQHEMGHVLGFGTLWDIFGLLQDPSLGFSPPLHDTFFSGPFAIGEFDAAGGVCYAGNKVPVENDFTIAGAGTLDSHWRESVFDNELMTGFINLGFNPLSAVSVAQFQDLGYVVDENFCAADPYALPGACLRSSLSGPAPAVDPDTSVQLEDDIWQGPRFGVTPNGNTVQLQ